MEEVLKNVADALAANTNYATLITTPQIKESKLKHLELDISTFCQLVMCKEIAGL